MHDLNLSCRQAMFFKIPNEGILGCGNLLKGISNRINFAPSVFAVPLAAVDRDFTSLHLHNDKSVISMNKNEVGLSVSFPAIALRLPADRMEHGPVAIEVFKSLP